MKTYFCGNFWICKKIDSNTIDIGYKDTIINKNIEAFSIFEEKILAILSMNTLFVYIIQKNGRNIEDAITLVAKAYKYADLEYIKINVNDYIYIINFNCKISCQGRV